MLQSRDRAILACEPATWPSWWLVGIGLGAGACFGVVVFLIVLGTKPTKDEVATCNAVVHTLLTTQSVIEVQRAGAIVYAMRCNVSRQLRADPGSLNLR
jgi:hypothetical protein